MLLNWKQAQLSGADVKGRCKKADKTGEEPQLDFNDLFKQKMMNLVMDEKLVPISFGTDTTQTCTLDLTLDKLKTMCSEPQLNDQALVKRFNQDYAVQVTPEAAQPGEGDCSDKKGSIICTQKVKSYPKGVWNESSKTCKGMPVGIRLSFVQNYIGTTEK